MKYIMIGNLGVRSRMNSLPTILLIMAISTHYSGLHAEPLRLLDTEHVSTEFLRYGAGRREPYLPEQDGDWTHGARFNFNLRFLHVFRWDNKLHMDGGSSRLYHAGWEYRVYMDLWPVQPFIHHHSQHALEDSPRGRRGFPVEDAYGIRIIFLDKKEK